VQEVDDATSEVFLGAFRRLDEFDGDGAAFRRWLFTIAHHRAIDAVRHQSRRAHDVPYEGESDLRAVRSAESEALRRIDSAAALALVAELPADQRAVLLLRTVADLPVAEVAQELDRSADAVRQLHRRALARLRARTVIQTVG
jgi:RNA polymerase sigma-70 factor (ECF subfamily)